MNEITYAKWLQLVGDLLCIELVAKGWLWGTLGKLLMLSAPEAPRLRAHGGEGGRHYGSSGAAEPRA